MLRVLGEMDEMLEALKRADLRANQYQCLHYGNQRRVAERLAASIADWRAALG